MSSLMFKIIKEISLGFYDRVSGVLDGLALRDSDYDSADMSNRFKNITDKPHFEEFNNSVIIQVYENGEVIDYRPLAILRRTMRRHEHSICSMPLATHRRHYNSIARTVERAYQQYIKNLELGLQ